MKLKPSQMLLNYRTFESREEHSERRQIWSQVLTALVAVGGLLFMTACGRKPESPATGTAVAKKVQVVTVVLVPLADTYDAVGSVASRQTVVIASKVMGTVTSVSVEEGSHVGSKQVVVELDGREARARLSGVEAELEQSRRELAEVDGETRAAEYAKSSAQASLTLAQQTFERFKELLARTSVSQQEFDEADAKFKGAQAEVGRAAQLVLAARARKERLLAKIDGGRAGIAEAKTQLTFTQIMAGVDGVVTAKSVNPGDLAVPGAPLLKLEKQQYRL
jgi:multidrug resistance efflux pump